MLNKNNKNVYYIMSYIFNSDYLSIKKGKKKYEFFFKINMDSIKNRQLWERVAPRYIKTLKQEQKDGSREIIVNADKIEKLSRFIHNTKLEYHIALKLIYNISTQIFLLKQINYGITHFDIDDIIVINNGKKFLFVNPSKITKIKFKQHKINKIIRKNKFCSPEILNLEIIPNKVHYKSSLYSLALLLIYCLTKEYVKDEPIKLIDFIYGTKLYWTLERCLVENPKKRYFYII